jgi:hypothetical protein
MLEDDVVVVLGCDAMQTSDDGDKLFLSPKRWYCIATQNNNIVIFTAMRTSDLTKQY